MGNPITLFLCGDVMTGRGIDQVLPHPVNPVLYESYVQDARTYVELAEEANGPISKPIGFDYCWGDALPALDRAGTDLRLINLETSITTSEDYWRDKPVLYRMHPQNIGCLSAARIDCCTLANNHVLDWGYAGLDETLRSLDGAAITRAGAGRTATEAAAPAVLSVPGKGRVLVFSYGSMTSGVPWEWRVTDLKPGVNLLPDLSAKTAERVAREMLAAAEYGDVGIASIHWGSNWGYEVPADQIAFARRLIDAGVSIVHGHSSHHVRPLELYHGGLILYGCGDFITDYEGIRGYEEFRGDLAIAYVVEVDPASRNVVTVKLLPFQERQLQLHHAGIEDVRWLFDLLGSLTAPLGTQVRLEPDNSMTLFKSEIHSAVRRSS
jgi:poly-gamma-glutamate synthesis protein (capsule biosynthesis protein)